MIWLEGFWLTIEEFGKIQMTSSEMIHWEDLLIKIILSFEKEEMSLLQRLFGGSKKENNVTSEQAIQRLSSVEDLLLKKQEHLEGLIETEKGNALRLSKQGDKKRALAALKKKKQYEKTLNQIDGTLTTIESQREALQNASTNKEVFTAIQQSSNALKYANGAMDADAVADVKDQMEEQLQLGFFYNHFLFLIID